MIDLLYAKQNIDKYKFDYQGYLVIVDQIRSDDILESNNPKKIKMHYNYLVEKYKRELCIISKIEKKRNTKSVSKMSVEQIKEEIKYIVERLPAIGFIILGLEKEIGIK